MLMRMEGLGARGGPRAANAAAHCSGSDRRIVDRNRQRRSGARARRTGRRPSVRTSRGRRSDTTPAGCRWLRHRGDVVPADWMARRKSAHAQSEEWPALRAGVRHHLRSPRRPLESIELRAWRVGAATSKHGNRILASPSPIEHLMRSTASARHLRRSSRGYNRLMGDASQQLGPTGRRPGTSRAKHDAAARAH